MNEIQRGDLVECDLEHPKLKTLFLCVWTSDPGCDVVRHDLEHTWRQHIVNPPARGEANMIFVDQSGTFLRIEKGIVDSWLKFGHMIVVASNARMYLNDPC